MKQTIWQIGFFGIVGVASLLIDMTVTYLLFYQVHLPAYLASALGFVSGFAFGFPMHRNQVFQHSPRDRYTLRTQMVLYATLSTFNLLASSLLVDVLVRFGVLEFGWAKAITVALFAVWNFLMMRLVVFAKRRQA